MTVGLLLLFNSFAIHFQASLPRKLMFNNGLRISELLKFRHPFADIFQIAVKSSCLEIGIEDAEIRGSITTSACSPLPIAVIGCKFIVQQFFCKIGFAPSPVDQ